MADNVLKSNDTLHNFATKYHSYKQEGLIPTKIATTMSEELQISKTQYYRLLRLCREGGIITDSYAEAVAERVKRDRCECVGRIKHDSIINGTDAIKDLPGDEYRDNIMKELFDEKNTPKLLDEDDIVEPKSKSNWFNRIINKIFGDNRY